MVSDKKIVGVFDIEKTSTSARTRAFLGAAQKAGQVITVGDDIPKAFVVCEDAGSRVYITQVAPATLLKRAGGKEAYSLL